MLSDCLNEILRKWTYSTEPLPKKNGGEEEVQGEDGEDPRNTLQHLLSQVKPPKVSTARLLCLCCCLSLQSKEQFQKIYFDIIVTH